MQILGGFETYLRIHVLSSLLLVIEVSLRIHVVFRLLVKTKMSFVNFLIDDMKTSMCSTPKLLHR
jgi:hypothetical protein